jgi:hypothetical protein
MNSDTPPLQDTVTPGSPAPEALQPYQAERRNGKVARLPKAIRHQLNTMLEDGVPYLQIIERLGPPAAGLIEKNLSTWKAGGYLDWLRENQLANALQAKHELAQAIVARSAEANGAGQAVLQIIAANLCEFLAETDPATLRESLLSDADKFTRFVNSMVRLAEGGIKCELHKLHHQDRIAEAASHKALADKPGISDESLRIAEEKLNLM